jgi:hypothetical protein
MSTGWHTKILATVALVAGGALSIGCGPAPGYEPEPRVPVGYANAAPVGESYPEPATAEELQARNEARQAEANAQGEVAVGTDTNEYADTDPSALTEFKPALDGHGAWVDDSTYGTVWVPAESEVGTDFVPYSTAGHWTYAEDTSYVWVSDYSWGWAPFHYGRWVHVNRHGWAWIPGRTYSGAWVTWRMGSGYDYVGWAPAGPDWYWYNGYAVGWTFGYSPYYSYCHRDYLYNPYVGRYVARGSAAREHEIHTRPYVAAAPAVGNGAGGAGSGRVAASPTVGGGGRVAASPTVGAAGRVAATPGVGPRPSELGIRHDVVVAPPSDHAGLARANAFATPSTAVAQGAAPPASVVRRRQDHDAIATNPAPRQLTEPSPRAPASNRFEPAARAPQVQGVAPSPPHAAASSAFDGRSSSRPFAAPSQSAPSTTPSPSFAQPTPSYRSPPSYAQQQPAARPQPSPSMPSQSSPPSFRSSPSFSQSTPSRSSPSFSTPSRSAPSFSQPSPSFRSTPTPSVQSRPSFSTPSRPSAPAAARPSMPSRSAAPTARSRR